MAQLRLKYDEIQKSGAEILQVTHSATEEAQLYYRHYQLTFPYLCDSDRTVHRIYEVPMAQKQFTELSRKFVACSVAATSDRLLRGEKTPSALPHLKRYGFDDPEQAVFIVDRNGIIRYVHSSDPIGSIPSNEELLRQLATL